MKKLLFFIGIVSLISLIVYKRDIALSSPTVTDIDQGGTNTSTAPTYGQLLIGDGTGEYAFTVTSSLGIPTATNDWSVSSTYGSPALTTTSSINLWAKQALYVSSTLKVDGLSTFSDIRVGGTAYVNTVDGEAGFFQVNVGGFIHYSFYTNEFDPRSNNSKDLGDYNDSWKNLYVSSTVFTQGFNVASLSQFSGLSTFSGGFISNASSSISADLQVAGALNASSSLFVSTSLFIGQGSGFNSGRFTVDGLTGNTSASGTIRYYGNSDFTSTTIRATSADGTTNAIFGVNSSNAKIFKINSFGDYSGNLTGNSFTMGGLPVDRSYAGLWLAQSSPSASNFLLLGNASQSFVNAPVGGTLELRVGNGSIANLGSFGFCVFCAANTAPVNGFPFEVRRTAAGGIIGLRMDSKNRLGIGTSTPFSLLSVHAQNGDTNKTLFAIASSTQTTTNTLFSVSNIGRTTIDMGANATTTIDIGSLGVATSKTCFNVQNTAGTNISFYFNGTTMVIENNACL